MIVAALPSLGIAAEERGHDEAADEPRSERTKPTQPSLAYGPRGSHLFAHPNPAHGLAPRGLPKATHRFNIPWLVSRAILGETAPRDEVIKLVWRTGHSKSMRTFDEQTRDVAITVVAARLLRDGIGAHVDANRAGAFLGWLVAALRNAATDELRRKRVPTVSDVIVTTGEDGEERERSLFDTVERHDAEGRPVIRDGCAGDPARGLEIRQQLEVALAVLDEREREVLYARVVAGESAGAVGQRLGLSAGRVRAIEARAKAKGRAALAASEEVPSHDPT